METNIVLKNGWRIQTYFSSMFCFILQISSTALENGIRLNVLCPAFVKTPMFDNLQANTSNVIGEKDQEKAKAFIQYIGVMR